MLIRRTKYKGADIFIVRKLWLRRLLFDARTLAFVFAPNCVVFRSELAYRNHETREHELEHVRQWKALGSVLYPVLYGLMHLQSGYEGNPFEKAARRQEETVESS